MLFGESGTCLSGSALVNQRSVPQWEDTANPPSHFQLFPADNGTGYQCASSWHMEWRIFTE